MISAWTRLSVLLCAAWCIFAAANDCRAQQTEAGRRLYEQIKAEAEKGDPAKQFELGKIHEMGLFGTARNGAEAVRWYRKSAEQENADAQHALALCCANGVGTSKDFIQAVKWFRRAAEQGHRRAQFDLAYYHRKGFGVPKDYVEAYKWYQLAALQGQAGARGEYLTLSEKMTRSQITKAEALVMEFNKHAASKEQATAPTAITAPPLASGVGFFITRDGYVVTTVQVARSAGTIRLLTQQGALTARVVRQDPVSGLAILKAEGQFPALPLASSRGVRLGSMPFVVCLAAKATESLASQTISVEVVRLTSGQDDPRHFELGVPSGADITGAALVDPQGNLIGVVHQHPSAQATSAVARLPVRKTSYAVKSSYLLGFLESLPEVMAKLESPDTAQRSREDLERQVRRAMVAVQVR